MILRRRLLTIFAVIAVAYVVYALSTPSNTPGPSNNPEPAATLVPADSSDVTLNMLDGTTKKLSDFKGKVLVIDVWASWCNPCRMSVPDMNKLSAEYADKGVVVIGVSIDDDKPAAERGIKSFGINYPVAWDGTQQLQKMYKVNGIPSMLIFNKKGELQHRLEGYDPSRTPVDIRKQLDIALK